MSDELVREVVDLRDGRPSLTIVRPASSEALIDDDAFAQHDEYLPYWAELWPSAVALARWLAAPGAEALAGVRVLELGCGLGLPSLAAARAGADVVATDWSADAIDAVRRNACANDLEVVARAADWREVDALTALAPFDLVLAADVLYEARHRDPLLRLIDALNAPRVLLADPSRSTAGPFLEAVQASHTVTTTADPDRPAVQIHELRPR
ncbi:MAG: Methyltransferase type 12 [Frankiales bacterium]|nr:Methyltransferase type 12 [Frankiales bacterium]MCW2998437.1 Methyltransferase type 12 [Solirubrobacterales bacterium]